MKVLIAQSSSSPSPVTPPTPSDLTGWSLLVAASVWIFRQAWELFASKEKAESSLIQTFIADLRADRTKLLDGNKEGFEKVVAAVGSQTIRTSEDMRDLTGLISRFSETLHTDVQVTLTKQTDIYVETKREISKMRSLIEDLDRKFDQMLQSYQNETLKK